MKRIFLLSIIGISLLIFMPACAESQIKSNSIKQSYSISDNKKNELLDKINKIKLKIIEILSKERLGSADTIDGTTLIVSIFANDQTTSFNYSDKEDINTINDCLDNLRIASAYLENEIKKYGVESKFIYNFNENSDLLYKASFRDNLVIETSEKYSIQNAYIKENINSEKLKEKYNASNIIYFFFFNTPFQNKVSPRTLRYTKGVNIDNEIVNLYIKFGDKFVAPPATYAHEILHTFGAQDLYIPSTSIKEEYVSYLRSSDSNDIMFTVVNGKNITNDFTELDAYYVGLTKESKEQKKWGLALSEH